MTAPSEVWVLCDDATHKDAPADALRLSLGASGQSMTVEIDGIVSTLTGRLRPQFTDLIRIAALVLGADGAVSRGRTTDDDSGDRWTRRFRVVVGVDDPALWTQAPMQRALDETLSFLSQDSFTFEFQQRKDRPVHQLVFSGPGGEPFLPWDQAQEVALFSGGLDSFAGAADLVLTKRMGAILVSHRSSPKVLKTQTTLVKELQDLARAASVPLPVHVAIEVTRHDSRMRVERTQRTRSLLYAAIAGAVADLMGQSRVRMHENGIVAINLPIAGSVVGARATRTAHPQVLLGFARILSLVAGRPFTVDNPFALMTRGEIIHDLGSTPAAHLARHTLSCAHVHKSSNMHPHCGACSQCIDRQFSFRSAAMQALDSEDGYALHLTQGEWVNESERNLLLNWIAAAERYASCRNSVEFLASFGEATRAVAPLMESRNLTSDTAAHAVFDLHKRHGEAVGKVLDDVCMSTAADVRRGRLKADTLPRLLYQQVIEKPATSPAAVLLQSVALKEDKEWRIRFRGGSAFAVPDSSGMQYLTLLLGAPGDVRSAPQLVALREGRMPPPHLALGARAVRAVQSDIRAVVKEREVAQGFCDDDAAQRCQSEIDALRRVVDDASTGKKRSAGAEHGRVEHDIRAAITVIARTSKSLGDHLTENIRIGPVFWYRSFGVEWEIARPTGEPDAPKEWVRATDLVNPDLHFIKDEKSVARFCEQQSVPTRPGKTRDGRNHPRRRDVHEPSFGTAMSRFRAQERLLQDAADVAVTARERRQGK